MGLCDMWLTSTWEAGEEQPERRLHCTQAEMHVRNIQEDMPSFFLTVVTHTWVLLMP